MKAFWSAVALVVASAIPKISNAQVLQTPTPPPPVATQYELWQFNDEPILVNGVVYYPTRETRFFDGGIMSQVATFRGVPVYADVTFEAHSVVYLPIGRSRMRGYERRREGELAGTTGSRMPAFPVEVASPLNAEVREGSSVPLPVPMQDNALATGDRDSVPRVQTTNLESVPLPRSNDGIWLEYAGARWYSDGPAVKFDADRFVEVGNYRGFAVYRDKSRGAEEIWVRITVDGPVAPYSKR